MPDTLCWSKIDSKIVDKVFETKFLEVVDEYLKFNNHVINVTKKISKFALIFYKIRKWLTNKNMIDFYHALVYPDFIHDRAFGGALVKPT